jgi:hypothetical protein
VLPQPDGQAGAATIAATDTRIELHGDVTARPNQVFAALCDPQGHVAIDSSGMLQGASGEPVTAAGDSCTVLSETVLKATLGTSTAPSDSGAARGQFWWPMTPPMARKKRVRSSTTPVIGTPWLRWK